MSENWQQDPLEIKQRWNPGEEYIQNGEKTDSKMYFIFIPHSSLVLYFQHYDKN